MSTSNDLPDNIRIGGKIINKGSFTVNGHFLPTEFDKELESFHPSFCDAFEILRGGRNLTDKPCSCGFEEAVNKFALGVEIDLLGVIKDATISEARITNMQTDARQSLWGDR